MNLPIFVQQKMTMRPRSNVDGGLARTPSLATAEGSESTGTRLQVQTAGTERQQSALNCRRHELLGVCRA